MNMKEDASSLRGVAKISGEVGDTGASKKTKVSIWLLKPDAPLDKLFGEEILSSTDIEGIGTVYTSEIPLGPPAWVETFFENKISGLTKGGAGAILKTSVEVDGEAQHFLVSFGLGFHKINQSLCEGRFGLKVVLNAGDLKNGVRSLDKRNLTAAPRLSREQASKQENLASFGIDFEQDILHSLTLASNDEDLGVSISGG
ncbi:MAG TPA: TIGR04141 family sporadically distributed protein, partial [Candidatus Saccharimonadales bacterium]